jgi:hypothetical protein
MNRNQEYIEYVDSIKEAVKQATFADDHGNGTGCTKSFVVRDSPYRVSVVRKHTFEKGSYYLFTVEYPEILPEWLIPEIESVFGMDDTDVTVTFEDHGEEKTCIVPTSFYQP